MVSLPFAPPFHHSMGKDRAADGIFMAAVYTGSNQLCN